MALEKIKHFINTSSIEELTQFLSDYGIEIEECCFELNTAEISKNYSVQLEESFDLSELQGSTFVFGEGYPPELEGQPSNYVNRKYTYIVNSCFSQGEEVA